MNKSNQSRRSFIKKTAASTAIIALGVQTVGAFLESCSPGKKMNTSSIKTGFKQDPLPYGFDALENVIDTTTMEIHYTKHAAAYAKNLHDAAIAEKLDTQNSLEDILPKISKYSSKLRNNAGGHYNHEMFWKCMRPKQVDNKPNESLIKAIEKKFSSFSDFKKQFADAGKNRFGSGWVWLCKNESGELIIGSTANQDNPLMDVNGLEIKGFPLLCLDVWEHAYYLKYQNKRAEYIENWWNVVNWDYVQNRYSSI